MAEAENYVIKASWTLVKVRPASLLANILAECKAYHFQLQRAFKVNAVARICKDVG